MGTKEYQKAQDGSTQLCRRKKRRKLHKGRVFSALALVSLAVAGSCWGLCRWGDKEQDLTSLPPGLWLYGQAQDVERMLGELEVEVSLVGELEPKSEVLVDASRWWKGEISSSQQARQEMSQLVVKLEERLATEGECPQGLGDLNFESAQLYSYETDGKDYQVARKEKNFEVIYDSRTGYHYRELRSDLVAWSLVQEEKGWLGSSFDLKEDLDLSPEQKEGLLEFCQEPFESEGERVVIAYQPGEKGSQEDQPFADYQAFRGCIDMNSSSGFIEAFYLGAHSSGEVVCLDQQTLMSRNSFALLLSSSLIEQWRLGTTASQEDAIAQAYELSGPIQIRALGQAGRVLERMAQGQLAFIPVGTEPRRTELGAHAIKEQLCPEEEMLLGVGLFRGKLFREDEDRVFKLALVRKENLDRLVFKTHLSGPSLVSGVIDGDTLVELEKRTPLPPELLPDSFGVKVGLSH